jgi:hypothetical protein
MVVFNKGKENVDTVMGSRESNNQNSMNNVYLWCWLVNHDIPRSEIDRKPTKFLLDLYKCNMY